MHFLLDRQPFSKYIVYCFVNRDDEHEDPASTMTADGELTMAQMFDQIKHCRYIRRYHPDGTALEEYF